MTMPEPIEILNGDDRAHALKTLKGAVKGASGAARTHLASVLRSLNPDAARSRAFKGDASMAKRTKKAAHHQRRRTTRKHNPTTVRQVATRAKERVRVVTRRAASNFKGADIMGILTEGAGVGLGLVGTNFVSKHLGKFLPASTSPLISSALASVAVGGAAVAFGGGKGITRYIAVGAVAELVHSVARNYLPAGTLAGVGDGTDATDAGYWDPATGQWIPYGSTIQGLAGITYDPAYPVPVTSDRPEGM
jgi:hypothetical protein